MGFWEWLGGGGGKSRGVKRVKEIQNLFFLPEIKITLEYKNIKNIILRIKSPTYLHISSPYGVSVDEIESVVRKREEWICTRLGTISKTNEESYQDNGEIYHLGEKKQICFSPSARAKVSLQEGVLEVEAKSEEHIKEAIQKWQKAEAYKVYAEVLAEWERGMSVKISHLSIKKMTSRWGSLNPKKGYINLNLSLIKMPRGVIEYVALHEMIHFFHYNHDKKFYAMMSEKMPDWQSRERELREWKRKVEC